MAHYVYIMASRPGGAIHIGHSSDLRRDVDAHRAGRGCAHTARYRIRHLVWFEAQPDAPAAARHAARLSRWARRWKNELILQDNPDWQDITHRIPPQP